MRYEATLHRFDEMPLYILQSYDVAEIHQYISFATRRTLSVAISE